MGQNVFFEKYLTSKIVGPQKIVCLLSCGWQLGKRWALWKPQNSLYVFIFCSDSQKSLLETRFPVISGFKGGQRSSLLGFNHFGDLCVSYMNVGWQPGKGFSFDYAK